MTLQLLPGQFVVCQITALPAGILSAPLVFVAKTDDELSLVCPENMVPEDALAVEPDWRALKITGVLDFGLVGIIAGISRILADEKIPLFVVSTFNTDYVLVKAAACEQAVNALRKEGYDVAG